MGQAGSILYVSEVISGRIESFTTTSTNPQPTTFASLGQNSPEGLALDASGNLYVGTFNTSTYPLVSTIEKFTPGGVGSVFSTTGVNGPFGLTFDTAGNLYAANDGSNTVEKYSPTGVDEGVYATTGPQSGYESLAFNSNGDLFVADYNNGTIYEFPPGGGSGSVFATTGRARQVDRLRCGRQSLRS